MTLNRNPDNFFTETEQVAFHIGHLVPGIDFTNDPLLQGRLFSYLDTQLNRFHSPNFPEIPINRPRSPVLNHNQDGFMRHTGFNRKANDEPNSINEGLPRQATAREHGFVSYPAQISGLKVRERSESFNDHFTQATLFWNSMSEIEKTHIVEAIHFELGKVERMYIRERMIQLFANIDRDLAARAAKAIGVTKITGDLSYLNEYSSALPGPRRGAASPGNSSSLSMYSWTNPQNAQTRKVAILVADGFDNDHVTALVTALEAAGVQSKYISKFGGQVTSANGKMLKVDKLFVTSSSVLFDAVFIPGGSDSIDSLLREGKAIPWVNETFQHCKAIAATGDAVRLLRASGISGVKFSAAEGSEGRTNDSGVITLASPHTESILERMKDTIGLTTGQDLAAVAQQFIHAIAQDRHWSRTGKDMVPA